MVDPNKFKTEPESEDFASTLYRYVAHTDTEVATLRTQVNATDQRLTSLEGAVSEGFKGVRQKLDEISGGRGVNWGLIVAIAGVSIAGISLIVTVMTVIGAMALSPVRVDATDAHAAITAHEHLPGHPTAMEKHRKLDASVDRIVERMEVDDERDKRDAKWMGRIEAGVEANRKALEDHKKAQDTSKRDRYFEELSRVLQEALREKKP